MSKKPFKGLLTIFLLFFIFSAQIGSYLGGEIIEEQIASKTVNAFSESEQLYMDMHLDGIVNFDIFDKAYIGYKTLESKNKNILTIIDFTLPSTEKRLYVLDVLNKKLLFHSYVSHGRNSGELYATSFSNEHGSYKSSLGFFETEGTYIGSNGYSLILNGLEKGINDQAKPRAIVMHGADYCSKAVIASSGRLGRSFGCPSLPRELTKPIIDTIKNGSLLFIYAENETYLTKSEILLPKENFIQLKDSLKSFPVSLSSYS